MIIYSSLIVAAIHSSLPSQQCGIMWAHRLSLFSQENSAQSACPDWCQIPVTPHRHKAVRLKDLTKEHRKMERSWTYRFTLPENGRQAKAYKSQNAYGSFPNNDFLCWLLRKKKRDQCTKLIHYKKHDKGYHMISEREKQIADIIFSKWVGFLTAF